MHGSYSLHSHEDKVKLWQSSLHLVAGQPLYHSAAAANLPNQYHQAYPPAVYLQAASYFYHPNMAPPLPTQYHAPYPLDTFSQQSLPGAPSQDVQLQTGGLEWEQYVQENWQERQTAPPDLDKFRAPSNIRGAPLEAEISLASLPETAHHRMDTYTSVASTVWVSSMHAV